LFSILLKIIFSFDSNLEEVPLIPIKQEGTTLIPPTKKSSRKRERPAKGNLTNDID
jgi:hypothetical protein